MKPTPTRITGIALIVLGVALGGIRFLASRQLPHYAATATVKIERDQMDLPQLANLPELTALVAAQVDTTYFIQTEIALLQSEATLGKVITQLDLNRVWGQRRFDGLTLKPAETLQLLKRRLLVQPGTEPNLITIQATSEIPEEAMALANATAQAYCDYRAEYRRRLTQTALNAIAGQHTDMEKSIAATREKLRQAELQLDPATKEKTVSASPGTESDALRTLRTRYAETVLRYLAQSNQLAIYQRQNTNVDDNVEQLKVRAEKAKAEMVAAESATRAELARHESVRAYQAARLELDELQQLSAPLRKAVASLQAELRPQGIAPARILEPASAATPAKRQPGAKDQVLFAGGGVTLVLGIGLLLLNPRRPTAPA